MPEAVKNPTRPLSATPWGLLPPRMQVLYISTARRTGAWLAEAFAGDSACQVNLEEARGAAAGLALLRERTYDAVLVSHEPGELDAIEFVEALRVGGTEEPLVILGQASEQELAAVCYEVGADAYVCANTATTRMLLWIVARATERHQLLRENRRSAQAERQRKSHDHDEAERLLSAQRGLIHQMLAAPGHAADAETASAADDPVSSPLGASLQTHYRELLRAHVMMGSGNLNGEMANLAQSLAAEGVSAPEVLRLHTQVLEELVRGLGKLSARHVMTRADLLALEMLIHLAECYRLRCGAPLAA